MVEATKMNIIEAMKSGKPFKTKWMNNWIILSLTEESFLLAFDRNIKVYISPSDMLRSDWEIKP
jgi:hypothetical protein